jgi:hypothetical protein
MTMHSRGTVSSRYACTRRLPACSPVHRDRTEGPSNFSTAVDRLQVYEVKAKYSCDRVSLAITSLKQARLGERISVRPYRPDMSLNPLGSTKQAEGCQSSGFKFTSVPDSKRHSRRKYAPKLQEHHSTTSLQHHTIRHIRTNAPHPTVHTHDPCSLPHH